MNNYIGVKELISELKEPFDANAKAIKKAKRNLSDRGERQTKESLEEETQLILADWANKRKRGEDIQKDICEKELKKNPKKTVLGKYDKSHKESDKVLSKSLSKLENDKVYLEKVLLSEKYKIIGYADKIEIKNNTINIYDNKVVENIYRTSSFTTDNGFKMKATKMFEPLDHLDDCNYNDFILQLSLYMYLAWEANKKLKIGKLYIRHIKMNDNNKIVKDDLIEVPYMKDEVKKILKYRKLNES